MIGFLLDTNVPSEVTRKGASELVLTWLRDFEKQSFLSTITLGEIRQGIVLAKDENKKAVLNRWLTEVIYETFTDRILPVSAPIAERWGLIHAHRIRSGKPMTVPDGLIAATALEHGLTLVTRNVRDFQDLGLSLVNPWE
ncbi:ribonuclease VapC [Bryobacterales bacterium F-183]|nr:ribonuclease VapC [Bryobacterales bacterium F-183]